MVRCSAFNINHSYLRQMAAQKQEKHSSKNKKNMSIKELKM